LMKLVIQSSLVEQKIAGTAVFESGDQPRNNFQMNGFHDFPHEIYK